MSIFAVVALLVAVLVGGALQRVAGMGFAMVVAPSVVLVLDGQQGVVLTNLLGAVAGGALIWAVRHDIDWKKMWLLSGGTVVGSVLGAYIVGVLDAAVLRLVLGVVLLLGIAASLFVGRFGRHLSDPSWAVLAGGGTGALVAISGIGGPPMTVYAVASNWQHRSFAATMQPCVALSSIVGALSVVIGVPSSVPVMPSWLWGSAAAALIAGLVIGQLLARVVRPAVGRWIVITLSAIGAVVAIASGISALNH